MTKQTQTQFKKSNYNVRLLKAEYSRSKASNNPMITIEYELANNEPALSQDGKEKVDINGLKGVTRIMLTSKNKASAQEIYSRLGLNPDDVLVDEECTESKHPDAKQFEGLLVNAQVGSEEEFARSAPKPARVNPETGVQEPAQKEGDFIINPSTGKKISLGFSTTLFSNEIWYKLESATA